MKGDDKLIAVLNQLLADESHCYQPVYGPLPRCAKTGDTTVCTKAIESQAHDEMHHAEWLIQRIIFLDGAPIVSKLNPIKIGKTVLEMVSIDQEDELGAVRSYNSAIGLAREVSDQATVDLLTKILKMEEGHEDWAEVQRDQIAQMGIENYLANQTGGVAA